MKSRILYIDDEPDLREIAVMSLELDPDFEVRSAASGETGLVEAKDWRPTLILLDVMMPGIDGPETSRRLRADPATAGIPFAFITAATRTTEAEALRELGPLDIIAKPFDPMTLAGQVRALLQGIG